jgi:hypothetical protein
VNDYQVAQALRSAGWPKSLAPTATAVILAEHRGTVRPEIQSPPNRDGSIDYGLMSINSKAHPEKLASGNWKNPVDNARMGLAVYNETDKFSKSGFTAWSVYPGMSSFYLPRGTAAVARAYEGAPVNPSDTSAPDTSGNEGALDKIAGFFTFITDKQNWIRLGMVVAGMILLFIALMKTTGLGAGVAKTAMAVATKGKKL